MVQRAEHLHTVLQGKYNGLGSAHLQQSVQLMGALCHIFSTSASDGRFMSHGSTYLQLVSFEQQAFGSVSSDDEVDIRMACADEMQDVRSLPEHQAAHDHDPYPTRGFLRWICGLSVEI